MRRIERDLKLMDQLFLKMFTRINSKYSTQNEVRIILGGRNIPSKSESLKGYEIKIPQDSVKRIYIHPKTPSSFIRKIEALKIPIVKAQTV